MQQLKPAMARGAADPRFTLAEELLLDLAAGRLHVSHVGRLAQARLGEGGADGTTEVLARCKGTHAERDLHKWAETQAWRGCMPLPYSFSVPMVQHGEAVAGVAHCLLPHELFATLGAAAPQVFGALWDSTRQGGVLDPAVPDRLGAPGRGRPCCRASQVAPRAPRQPRAARPAGPCGTTRGWRRNARRRKGAGGVMGWPVQARPDPRHAAPFLRAQGVGDAEGGSRHALQGILRAGLELQGHV